MSQAYRAYLQRFIAEHFDLEELGLLCFELGVKYDNLGSDTLDGKAMDLVLLMQRRNQLHLLDSAVSRTRPSNFDPPSTGSAASASTTPRALRPPAPPHPFVNRKDERRALTHALLNGRGQAHTLVGLGGVGKTALAAQVLQDVAGDFTSVLWLSLEMAPQAETLCAQIAAFYELPPALDAAANARAALAQHCPLLALDNAESAPGVARALLELCQGAATVLLTTRERTVSVGRGGPPQGVPPLPRADAVELFRARAGGDHDQALIEQLCELLGDLPLAVNLAAGYITGYQEPLGDYLALLQSSPLGETLHLGDERRDLSVPVTFGLTHARLDDDAKLALQSLALDGGQSSAAGAVAAGAGWAEGEDVARRTRQALNQLTGHSLAERDEQGRYGLHPLVRRYAAEGLDQARRDEIQARLTAHYLAYARSHRQPTASDYDALQAELDNVLAAMQRAYQGERWGQVRRFAWALCRPVSGYLGVRGHWGELRVRLEQAVHAAEAEGHQRDTAAFSGNLATLLMNTGNLTAARQEYQRVLTIFEELGERESIAVTYHQLGLLAQGTGEYDEARRLYRDSLEIAEELGDKAGIARSLHQLGRLAQDTGEYNEARRLYRDSLEIKQELGNKAGIASTLHQLGMLAQATEEYDEARRLYRDSLEIEQELGNKAGIASTRQQMGALAQIQGNVQDAQQHYNFSIKIFEEMGDIVNASIGMFNLALLCEEQGRLDEALPLLERAVEIAERVGMPQAENRRNVLERVREKLGE